jgi:hypothetical protein
MFFQFLLTYDGTTTEVEQPEGFDALNANIKRDFKSHGLVFQFTSGSLKLGFSGTGRTVLYDAFKADGDDAEVTITINRKYENWQPWTLIYTGTAIMENRDIGLDYFQVDFENIDFIQKFQNFKETVISTGTTEDLEGNSLQPLTKQEIPLYSKRLLEYYQVRRGEGSGFITIVNSDRASPAPTTEFTRFFVFNLTDFVEGSLGGWQTDVPTAFFDVSAFPDTANYINQETGLFTFGGSIKFNATMDVVFDSVGVRRGTVSLKLYKNGVAIDTFYSKTTDAVSDDTVQVATGIQTVELDYTEGLNEFSLDEFLIVFEWTGIVVVGSAETITMTTDIDLYNSSYAKPSILTSTGVTLCECYTIHQLLRRATEIITGSGGSIYSDYFGHIEEGYNSDGCGALNVIPSGYQLRTIDRDPSFSLQEFLESLQSLFAVGWGIEYWTDEFQSTALFDAGIMAITGNYQGRIGGTVIISGSGSNDGPYSVTSVNFTGAITQITFDRPTVGELGGPTITFSSSGYRLRVEPFEYFYSNEQLLSFDEVEGYKETAFEDLLFNEVEIGYEVVSNDEDNPNTLDDYNTKGTWTTPLRRVKNKKSLLSKIIGSPYLLEEQRRRQFDETPNQSFKYDDDLFIINCQRGGAYGLEPISTELWDEVSGIIDPSTTYNLALNPLYMLFQHAVYLNATTFGKQPTDYYRNTDYKANGDLVLKLAPYANCEADLIGLSQLIVSQNIQVGAFKSGERIWEPTLITCRVALSDDELVAIQNAMQGIDSYEYPKYGYISVPNNEGETVSGWIIEVPYEVPNGIAELQLLKAEVTQLDGRGFSFGFSIGFNA